MAGPRFLLEGEPAEVYNVIRWTGHLTPDGQSLFSSWMQVSSPFERGAVMYKSLISGVMGLGLLLAWPGLDAQAKGGSGGGGGHGGGGGGSGHASSGHGGGSAHGGSGHGGGYYRGGFYGGFYPGFSGYGYGGYGYGGYGYSGYGAPYLDYGYVVPPTYVTLSRHRWHRRCRRPNNSARWPKSM